jgi:hypothetical protein
MPSWSQTRSSFLLMLTTCVPFGGEGGVSAAYFPLQALAINLQIMFKVPVIIVRKKLFPSVQWQEGSEQATSCRYFWPWGKMFYPSVARTAFMPKLNTKIFFTVSLCTVTSSATCQYKPLSSRFPHSHLSLKDAHCFHRISTIILCHHTAPTMLRS